MRLRTVFRCLLLASCGCGSGVQPGFAQSTDQRPLFLELKKLSVEQLADIDVTSVSRSEEALSSAPAAVTVVTSEDIRRSGATTVPDALRGVPGIQVAQQRASAWALSARGFTSVSSEKLLVLSDTRSIYTPLFSGVLWDVQDYLLQDIDRIEVIRGPGATLWGSNAVNGVINITTKSAKDTQGLFVETSGGTEELGTVSARYGGKSGDRVYYRVFGKYFDRAATFVPPRANDDDWQMGHGGFRADIDGRPGDTFTLQGDVYQADMGLIVPSINVSGRVGPRGNLRARAGGGNILGRWRHQTSGGGDLQLRVYYDRTHRNDPSFVDDLNTFDLDVQDRVRFGGRQDVTWGTSYRRTGNTNTGKGIFALDPAFSSDTVFSGFVQDQIGITSSIRLTAGTKLEHNDFSGAEVQPSVRIAWDLARRQTLWGSVSRAARVPTRLERDIAVDVTPPGANPAIRLLGNSDFYSEELIAYELGYRWKPLASLFVDAAAFENRYTGLASLELGQPFRETGSSRTVVPIVNKNLTDGHSTGLEVQATLDPTRWWRLIGSSSTIVLDLDPAGQDLNRGVFLDGATPRHQLAIRSSLDLPHQVQLDALLRHLTALKRIPQSATGEGVPAYAELDVRLAWQRWRHAELSVVGQNLLHEHHPEYGTPASRGELQRGVYAGIAWGF